MRHRLTKYLLLLFTVLLFCGSTPAQSKGENDGGGVVFGSDHAYVLTAPKGWVLDNQAGVGQGLYAVLYPNGSSWEKGPVVMYANTFSKHDEKQTLEDGVNGDVAEFKTHSPDLKVVDAPAIAISPSKTATVKYFTSDQYGNFEAVAYINETKTIVMIVLTSRTKNEFDTALPAFDELVRSYKFITENVVIQK